MPYVDLPDGKAIGSVDGGNSTTTALASGASFTGIWRNVELYPAVVVAARTDQAGTLYVDFSPDGTNADSTLTYSVSSSIGDVHKLAVTRKFFRVRFTNTSASPQTYLRLQALVGNQVNLTAPLNASIQQDADAAVVRSIDFEFDIAAGRASGVSIVQKYGKNADIDTGSVPEDIWDGSGVYTGFPTGAAETVDVFSSSVNDTAAGSGARTMFISGLDANYAAISETITLNGTTPVTSANQYTRCTFAYIVTSGSSNQAFNAGIITVRHTTTTSNVFQQMQVGTNTVNNSAYTIPAGKTGYVKYINSVIQGNVSAYADVHIWTRAFGQSPRLRRPYTVAFGSVYTAVVYGGIVFPEKSDIILRVVSVSGNNIVLAGGYDLILVDN